MKKITKHVFRKVIECPVCKSKTAHILVDDKEGIYKCLLCNTLKKSK